MKLRQVHQLIKTTTETIITSDPARYKRQHGWGVTGPILEQLLVEVVVSIINRHQQYKITPYHYSISDLMPWLTNLIFGKDIFGTYSELHHPTLDMIGSDNTVTRVNSIPVQCKLSITTKPVSFDSQTDFTNYVCHHINGFIQYYISLLYEQVSILPTVNDDTTFDDLLTGRSSNIICGLMSADTSCDLNIIPSSTSPYCIGVDEAYLSRESLPILIVDNDIMLSVFGEIGLSGVMIKRITSDHGSNQDILKIGNFQSDIIVEDYAQSITCNLSANVLFAQVPNPDVSFELLTNI